MNLRIGAVASALLMVSVPVDGWGPHSEIVDAALAVLPPEDHGVLVAKLGDEARRLRFLVWMGDFGNQLVEWKESWNPGGSVGSAVEFYANDYLIFPGAPRLYKHECPDVMHTFTPFFLRSVQALETETAINAARWIGSLLHFTTDTGSPPHAAGISGDTHSKMENWITASTIGIPEYKPRLLGNTPAEAAHGFKTRMAGLIAFSKQRAERLYPFMRVNDRAGAEPIVLESANETARVTADLLHTLCRLSSETAAASTKGAFIASITAPVVTGATTLPAKLMFLGTSWSTMSELSMLQVGTYRGVFIFRNISPGTYRAAISRPGARSLFVDSVKIASGRTTTAIWQLEPAEREGNLIQNPDFRIRWRSGQPDHWEEDRSRGLWTSDNIRVEPGLHYRFEVDPGEGRAPQVELHWYRNHWQVLGEPVSFVGGENQVAPQKARYGRIIVRTGEDPASALRYVSLRVVQ